MPGSLLNLGRSRLTRHDSTRSDTSTYSNDSKKRVSFNKAVRVKKYTRSEDGDDDPRRWGRKFWFKVYEDDDYIPDRWEEYSGDEEKGFGDDRLKTIDESPGVNSSEIDTAANDDVKTIIDKFNRQSLDRKEHAAAKYDSLTKYKRNSILNGMKSLFGSASFRSKKKNGSVVQEKNLENLFRSNSNKEENILNGDAVLVEKQPDNVLMPKIPDKHSYSKLELDNKDPGLREGKTVVEVEKWDSGDKLIYDAKEIDKSVEKTDDGELTRTVEQGDKIWKNITRTITYAESSPKIIRKPKERTNNSTKSITNGDRAIERSRSSNKSLVKRNIATQCTQVPETKSKNFDKYKVIRSRNGIVSAYSNVPPLDDEQTKPKRMPLNIDRINRPTTCKRDHQYNDTKRESPGLSKPRDSKLLNHTDNIRKNTADHSAMSKESSHRKTEPKLAVRSTTDYRRGYSTLSARRRESRNRARSQEDRIPNISGVKILVNGESVDDSSVRGGLAAAYKTRQRGRRTSSNSPVREFKTYGPATDTDPAYNHETVVLYIPGISHQEKRAEEEERISGGTVTRTQSMSSKKPPRHKKYNSVKNGLHLEEYEDDDESVMEDKQILPPTRKLQWAEYRTLANV